MPPDGLPRLPDSDPRDPPPTESARNSATCLAMALMLGLLVGLAFLIGAIIPTAFYILLLIAAFSLFFGAHYFVWGRFMPRRVDDEEDPPPQWKQPPHD